MNQKNQTFQIILSIAAVLLIAGCNSNSTNPMNSLNPGSIAADLPDGSEFLSSNAKVEDQSNAYIVYATEDAGLPQDEIHVSIPEGASVPFTAQASDGSFVQFFNVANGNTYEANSAQGYCTVTVTQISPTFEGTFSARVVCPSIADSIVLSNGAFNATYN